MLTVIENDKVEKFDIEIVSTTPQNSRRQREWC